MKTVNKIIILIIIQIIIIIASFLLVAYLESQKILAGHTINTAGKNRVLASQVEVELYTVLLNKNTIAENDTMYNPPHIEKNLFNALDTLRENIHVLKNGGKVSDMNIPPISQEFNKEWSDVAEKFDLYHATLSSLAINQTLTLQDIEEAKHIGAELITLSDTLTAKLSKELELFSFQMIILQILLGVINVIIHVIIIWMILHILKKYATEKTEQEKFIALGEFASILAHDIRNPLGTIYNSIQFISRNIQDERSKKEVNRINRSINRMSHQIEGVLNYVKVPILELKPHSLKDMLEYCIKDMKIPNNIKLNLPTHDTTIYCDEKKIEFVFTNLLLNAIQIIDKNVGYISVNIKEDMMDQVIISFENSGENIPKENIEKIFEPLFTTKMHGTGLGLTSCRNIIDVHGGVISASNNPVTFMITLPRYGNL